MKIAIIGTGNVGGTLAQRFVKAGHEIFLGVRDPDAPQLVPLNQSLNWSAGVHSVLEASRKGDIILLCTPWSATEQIVKSIAAIAAGKIIVDCTNPLKKDLSGLEVGFNSSGGELVQSWAPAASVVKCFNTTGFNIMADPILESRKTAMFYCGNYVESRKTVGQLVREIGFEPVDAGPIASSRLLEPFALLWIQSAYKHGMGRDFSFGILRKQSS